MNKYELEKTLNIIEIVRDLCVQHIPEIYSREIIPKVIDAKKRIEKDIKDCK